MKNRLTQQAVLDVLATVCYPITGKDLVASKMVEDSILISDHSVYLTLIFDRANDFFVQSVVEAVENALYRTFGNHIVIKGNISIVCRELTSSEPKFDFSEGGDSNLALQIKKTLHKGRKRVPNFISKVAKFLFVKNKVVAN